MVDHFCLAAVFSALDCPASLAACALVSRQWRAVAAQFLFTHACLHAKSSHVITFSQHICPQYGMHITSVELPFFDFPSQNGVTADPEMLAIHEEIAQCFEYLTSLREITFHLSWKYTELWQWFYGPSFEQIAPQITSLRFTTSDNLEPRLIGKNVGDMIAPLLDLFSSATSVYFSGCRNIAEYRNGPPLGHRSVKFLNAIAAHSNLKELESVFSQPFARTMPALPPLQILRIDNSSRPESILQLSVLATVLRLTSTTLQELSLIKINLKLDNSANFTLIQVLPKLDRLHNIICTDCTGGAYDLIQALTVQSFAVHKLHVTGCPQPVSYFYQLIQNAGADLQEFKLDKGPAEELVKVFPIILDDCKRRGIKWIPV